MRWLLQSARAKDQQRLLKIWAALLHKLPACMNPSCCKVRPHLQQLPIVQQLCSHWVVDELLQATQTHKTCLISTVLQSPGLCLQAHEANTCP